jgi:hypothetical protein
MEDILEQLCFDALRSLGPASLCQAVGKALARREEEIERHGEGFCPGSLLAVNAMRAAVTLTCNELDGRLGSLEGRKAAA